MAGYLKKKYENEKIGPNSPVYYLSGITKKMAKSPLWKTKKCETIKDLANLSPKDLNELHNNPTCPFQRHTEHQCKAKDFMKSYDDETIRKTPTPNPSSPHSPERTSKEEDRKDSFTPTRSIPLPVKNKVKKQLTRDFESVSDTPSKSEESPKGSVLVEEMFPVIDGTTPLEEDDDSREIAELIAPSRKELERRREEASVKKSKKSKKTKTKKTDTPQSGNTTPIRLQGGGVTTPRTEKIDRTEAPEEDSNEPNLEETPKKQLHKSDAQTTKKSNDSPGEDPEEDDPQTPRKPTQNNDESDSLSKPRVSQKGESNFRTPPNSTRKTVNSILSVRKNVTPIPSPVFSSPLHSSHSPSSSSSSSTYC